MWDRLKSETRPVVLYGTGDAAEKILKELDIRDIRVSGIFASDGFVRDRSFAGYKVLSYRDACERFGSMCVLLCFGSHRPEVMENIIKISREQDLYAPDLPVAGTGLFDRQYYLRNKERLDAVFDRLADEQSRSVFSKVIEYKLGGRIDPLLECSTPEEDNWKLLFKNLLDERYAEASYAPVCPDRAEGLSFLDLGAYTGDTAGLFIKLCEGKYSRIIAVEPEKRNFRKLSENLSALGSVELINAAAGASDKEIIIEKGKGRGGKARDAGPEGRAQSPEQKDPAAQSEQYNASRGLRIMQRSTDSILEGRPVDMIKMDIEGSESDALDGAADTIRNFRPRMIIAAYHRTEDLFAIPEKVLAIRPDYRLYLRKDPCIPAWGVNYIFV